MFRSRYCCSAAAAVIAANWKILILGQCLSLLLACGAAAQATLFLDCGLSAPTFTMALVYLGLSLLHIPILLWRKRKKETWAVVGIGRQHQNQEEKQEDEGGVETRKLQQSMHDYTIDVPYSSFSRRSYRWYFLLAFLDVEANAITMLSFRYTTLTSVTLFDALAVPAAMVVSKCFFFSCRRYRPMHYLGVIICMVGIVLNVVSDTSSNNNSAHNNTISSSSDDEREQQQEYYYPHKIEGDLCAIIGGLLYGANDVLTEASVSTGDTTEYLGMVGIFGFFISLIQSFILERNYIRLFWSAGTTKDDGDIEYDSDLSTSTTMICSTPTSFLLLFTFVAVTMMSYIGGSHFLLMSEAAFFNLSLLTGDLWSVIFSIVAERIIPHALFFLALALVLSGVVVYEMAPSPAPEKGRKKEELDDSKDDIKNDACIELNESIPGIT